MAAAGRCCTAAVIALVVLSGSPVVAAARPKPANTGLRGYLRHVRPAASSYRLLLERLEAMFSQVPIANVDPFVGAVARVSADLGRLAHRWSALATPRNLRARHRDMRMAFALESRGLALWADAVSTRDPDVIEAETEHLHGFLRSAAYLQRRWAAALRGALRRAELPVPRWVQGMATVRVR